MCPLLLQVVNTFNTPQLQELEGKTQLDTFSLEKIRRQHALMAAKPRHMVKPMAMWACGVSVLSCKLLLSPICSLQKNIGYSPEIP